MPDENLLGDDYFHFRFDGAHVLFPSVTLRSFSGFLLGSLVTFVVCLAER
jgi:hypothetical protein